MIYYTVWYWLKDRPTKEMDAAHEAGLTDVKWVHKGGFIFAEFKRQGDSLEAVAKAAAEDLTRHGVPFDKRSLNKREPT
ncbi:MAG: hypothetical protein EOQ56_27900 [Mesorhizobium sp.]|nr:MAG: hypothetical protein EOQ56_27900 [Mesorhizobium sp.]